jgi:hypothetical protein
MITDGEEIMGVRYAVIGESGDVENVIVIDPETVDEFAIAAGLTLRPATESDVVSQPQDILEQTETVVINRDDLARLAEIFDTPLTGSTITGLKNQMTNQMSEIAGVFKNLL